jgi:hypothetical protein
MKFHKNDLEVIVFSNLLPAHWSQKEHIHWFTTMLQPIIDKQQERTKRVYLKNLTDTPAIYLS